MLPPMVTCAPSPKSNSLSGTKARLIGPLVQRTAGLRSLNWAVWKQIRRCAQDDNFGEWLADNENSTAIARMLRLLFDWG